MDNSRKMIILALLIWIILPDFIPGHIDDFIAVMVALNQIQKGNTAAY